MYKGTLQAVSNREDWSQAIVVTDAETGETVAISRAALWVCRENDPACPVLSGSTADGKLVLTTDGFDIAFAPADLGALEPGMYAVFVRIELPTGQVVQLIAGELPVVEGGPQW
jgi:hypothetical protein